MRIALAQINSSLADFDANAEKIISHIKTLTEKKAELIVFPEASLFGYHPFDLLERETLITQQNKALQKILKAIPQGVHILVGGFEKNKNKKGRPYFNSAFLCKKNKIVKIFRKQLLPTGDVFDEARFIEQGDVKQNYFQIGKKKFFLTICEDMWAWPTKEGSEYAENPLLKVPKKKIDLVINMSASPFFTGKFKKRQFMAAQTAKHFKAPLLYVNLVGAQDEIIYDGQSFLVSPKDKILFKAQSFAEDTNVIDLNTLETWSPSNKFETPTEELRKALVLGLKDYAQKIGVSKVHLGLSGGIDSALVAALAVDAFGSNNVKLFALPTEYNVELSMTYARQLAVNLGAEFKVMSIQSTFEFIRTLLDGEFNVEKFGLMHENLQSRIRGLFMMAYSNFTGSLLLTTGNKSEYATGYATLYGDMCGGLAPLGDLTKKQIVELCEHYNKEIEIIPDFIIRRPPSAELRPNQKDQDSLPPYELLDKAVQNVVEKKKPAKTETEKWLLKQLMKTEFKRWQAPPILKVTEHSFGRGRRYPIAHKAKE
ncbi:NAD+ synthase [Pseudobdellovibrio sp. HCB154]|uniref:NAD+ synthase n=1 Tax=Pseudobdellovibrio sp. HCB154 TaxID=3386277 RepID=UPI0039174F5D